MLHPYFIISPDGCIYERGVRIRGVTNIPTQDTAISKSKFVLVKQRRTIYGSSIYESTHPTGCGSPAAACPEVEIVIVTTISGLPTPVMMQRAPSPSNGVRVTNDAVGGVVVGVVGGFGDLSGVTYPQGAATSYSALPTTDITLAPIIIVSGTSTETATLPSTRTTTIDTYITLSVLSVNEPGDMNSMPSANSIPSTSTSSNADTDPSALQPFASYTISGSNAILGPQTMLEKMTSALETATSSHTAPSSSSTNSDSGNTAVPSQSERSNSSTRGIIIGCIVGAIALVALISFSIWFHLYRRSKTTKHVYVVPFLQELDVDPMRRSWSSDGEKSQAESGATTEWYDAISQRIRAIEQTVAQLEERRQASSRDSSSRRLSSASASDGYFGEEDSELDAELAFQIGGLQSEVDRLQEQQQWMTRSAMSRTPPPEYSSETRSEV